MGIVGGGRREWTCPMVAATYEGAARALGRVPAVGLLVADEVHHLPADTYRAIAQAAMAPFRLGLSATLARSDGRERDLSDLLGGVVYTERPDALAAEGYLAPFDEVRLRVDLGTEDRAAYDRDMGIFRAYRARRAWARESALAFLERVRKRSSFDAAARAALLAYQRAHPGPDQPGQDRRARRSPGPARRRALPDLRRAYRRRRRGGHRKGDP
jgi:superfamily II DNA or RNA helicase